MAITPTDFDLEQAISCADSFSAATGLGCTISDSHGEILYETGDCTGCSLCRLLNKQGRNSSECVNTHLYGVIQAERLGGKYIYFCSCGLTYFVSPLFGDDGNAALLTVGPLLMVEQEDYLRYDLMELLQLPAEKETVARQIIRHIPYCTPERVTKMANLLYMAVGFLNRSRDLQRLQRNGNAQQMQGAIGEMLYSLKQEDENGEPPRYPFELEGELLEAIRTGNKADAQRILNEILGHIFFCSSGNFEMMRARVCELLVLLSRASMDGGGDANQIFGLNCRYIQELYQINTIDDLCVWLAAAMNRYTDFTFRFNDVKHSDVIRKAGDYSRRNYASKMTLEGVAAYVFLSPSYFSKVFKDEMGCNFNHYLNHIRIEKSKQLLLTDSIRLVDVSGIVGFEDQSYFTKVFKKLTGITPGKFREARGQIRATGFTGNSGFDEIHNAKPL